MARQSKPHLDSKGYYRTRIDGQEIHLGRDRRAAFAEFHRLMARREAEALSDRPQTVNGAVVAWLKLNSKPCYAQWLQNFNEYAGQTFLDDVERDLLTRYHVHLKGLKRRIRAYVKASKSWEIRQSDRPLTDETIRHFVRVAVSVLRWAYDQGWTEVMPTVPKLPNAMRQTRDLDAKRIASTFETLTGRAGAILRFIYATGCRPSEACKLQWKHVHLDRGLCLLDVHKTAGKSRKPRSIYLTPEADRVIRAALAERPLTLNPEESFVFMSGLGKPYTSGGLRSILKRHSGGATPYQLRHTFAQTGSDAGVPLEVLAKLLGHTTTRSTGFYQEVRDGRAVAAARGLKLAPTAVADAG